MHFQVFAVLGSSYWCGWEHVHLSAQVCEASSCSFVLSIKERRLEELMTVQWNGKQFFLSVTGGHQTARRNNFSAAACSAEFKDSQHKANEGSSPDILL
ncbi:uncharacterized protein AAGF69_001833 isoform 1-T5 [Amazona ochrocephala]